VGSTGATGATGGSNGNYAAFTVGYNNAQIHSQTQTGGQDVAVAALIMRVQNSGNFQCAVHLQWGDNTPGATVQHRVFLEDTFTSAPGSFFAHNTTPGSPGAVELGPSYPLSAAHGMALLDADAAGVATASLTWNGSTLLSTAGASIQTYSRNQDVNSGATGANDNTFDWSGDISASGLAVGTYVALVVVLTTTNAGDQVSYGPVTMSAAER